MYEGEHGEVRGKPKMLYSARDWGGGTNLCMHMCSGENVYMMGSLRLCN